MLANVGVIKKAHVIKKNVVHFDTSISESFDLYTPISKFLFMTEPSI